MIFNWTISNLVNSDPDRVQELQERIVLHELGHYFSLPALIEKNDVLAMKTHGKNDDSNNVEDKLNNAFFTDAQLRQI